MVELALDADQSILGDKCILGMGVESEECIVRRGCSGNTLYVVWPALLAVHKKKKTDTRMHAHTHLGQRFC